MKHKIRTQQSWDGELGIIIAEMGQAMWRANKACITYDRPMTLGMSDVLGKFQDYCARYIEAHS